MAEPWFRLYHEFAGDPLVQTMPEAMQRRWIMILCFKKSGALEKFTDSELASAMKISEADLAETKSLFAQRGFIDGDWQPRNWKKRQEYDPKSKDRSKKYRDAKRDASVIPGVRDTAHSRASVSVSVSESLEGDARGNLSTAAEPGPEFTALGHLAIEMSSVLALGSWVSNMARLGYTAPMVRYALEEGAAAGKWDQRWLQGILKRVAVDGVPEREASPANGHASIAAVQTAEQKADFERAMAERAKTAERIKAMKAGNANA